MSSKLTEIQRRHLAEMLPDLYWHPTGREWASAYALERKGMIQQARYSGRGFDSTFELTDAGRAATTSKNGTPNQ